MSLLNRTVNAVLARPPGGSERRSRGRGRDGTGGTVFVAREVSFDASFISKSVSSK